jgi:hypothetical protein
MPYPIFWKSCRIDEDETMKAAKITAALLMCLGLTVPVVLISGSVISRSATTPGAAAPAEEATAKEVTADEMQGEKVYSALAELPVAGTTLNVKIYINGYSAAEDFKGLNSVLLSSGEDEMLKALRKMKARGRIQQDGTVSFYDLKLIVSTQTPKGRHIYAITDRPIGFLEAYVSSRSKDYRFGILELDLQANETGKEKGEGTLIYAAKIKVMDEQKVDVENFTFAPIRLLGVREL